MEPRTEERFVAFFLSNAPDDPAATTWLDSEYGLAIPREMEFRL
jgi:hypothetical protein